ncbi:ATP-binding protein [Catenuloplanes sp. NPDC051500]|uniref:sensor histidine kinase n=1 Tax=Catenuloplanes sp. NPDC051500 TaxID=3363959 RepID=UPI0037A45AFD
MKPTTTALRRRFVWLVVVLATAGVLQVSVGQVLLSRFEAHIGQVEAAQESHQLMLQALTDAETGVRGFRLTGDRLFLGPYDTGVAAYPQALAGTRRTASEQTRERLSAEDAAARRWLEQFALPSVTVTPQQPGDAAALDERQGKRLFDTFRAAHDASAGTLDADRRAAVREFRRSSTTLQVCLALLAVVTVFVALRLSVHTHHLLLRPLAQVQTVLNRLRNGDRSARAAPAGPAEVRLLAETLNSSLDETERAEAQLRTARDALAVQEAYLAQVLDAIDVGVLTCDASGAVVRVNRTGRQQLGATPPTHISGLADGTIARALDGETVTGLETVLRRTDGVEQAVIVDARPMYDWAGHLVGAVATTYDVSVLRAREAELTAFAGIVAHDLRAPLAAVAGFTELLGHDLHDSGGQPVEPGGLLPTVARIQTGVERMRQLIDDLLAYATARDAPLHPGPVDLTDVTSEVITERTAHLHADRRDAGPPPDALPEIVTETLPVVHADAGMIRQVLDNLIGNALKYTRPGHPAHVTITADDTGDGWARITIADQGIGIPAGERDDVFNSFHRAHAGSEYTGTGLGLAICRRVMDRHGGSITLDENPAGGTRVHLTLPTTPAGPPSGADRLTC